jgi:hypothetical protein
VFGAKFFKIGRVFGQALLSPSFVLREYIFKMFVAKWVYEVVLGRRGTEMPSTRDWCTMFSSTSF